MDETTAGSYADYASTATATCTTCPNAAEGLFAGAQQFEGKGKGVELSDISHFEWGPNSSFTIELWMRTNNASAENQVIIGRKGGESHMQWWLGVNRKGDAEYAMYDRSNKGFSTVGEGSKINDGKWHHLVVVRDGRLRLNKLYVDGYTVGNYQYDYNDNFESASPVNIGFLNLNQGYGYKGLLDELIVYNRALEETEVRSRYNGGAGNYCGPQLVKPMIMSEAVTHGVAEQGYTYAVKAVGNAAPTFQLLEAPAGMTVNATTGEINWMPPTEGDYKVTVQATNSSGEDKQTYTIRVKRSLGEKTGMLHHWMLHEITGTRYRDFYTPYDALATAESKPKPVSGAVSGGQEFDGVDDGLDVEESYNFDWKADESFSLELWLRTEASLGGNKVLIGRDAKDSEAHWWIGLDGNGRAGFQLLDLNWQGVYTGESGPVLNDGGWHQVVAVRSGDANLTELYVDGVKVAQSTHRYTGAFDSRSPVNIGYLNDGDGYHYQGVLDEVKLFGRALSAAEVQERYSLVYDAITELVSFNGRYNAGTVLLTWETAAEAGVVNFEVERAPDTEQFELLGAVDAVGNTNTRSKYSFNDTEPLPEGYYRLKINNANGTYTYSNIIFVKGNGLTATYFVLYPNPVVSGQELTASLSNLPPGETVTFFLSDLAGRKLLEQEVEVDESGELRFVVPLRDEYNSGIYTVGVISSKRMVARKLMLQR